MIKITIIDLLEKVLNDMVSRDGIQASAIVSNDGLVMASNINTRDIDARSLGAVIAMLTRSAVHTVKELNKGEIGFLLVNTNSCQIIITKVASGAILTVLTDNNVEIGLTLKEMKRSCNTIKNIFARV